jgi:imidazolonepropionase
MQTTCDSLIYNVNIATMINSDAPYGAIDNGCVAIKGEHIVFVGKQDDCNWLPKQRIDAQQQWLLPGFIDCHTHLVYGGDRADEFEMRLNGKTYQQIAQAGGGIKRTVEATRAAPVETLLQDALARAKKLINEGVTSIEVKSGYGLNLESEVKMLQVARLLEKKLEVNIHSTFLGAHALPAEFADDADGYIDYLCQQCIPYIAEHKLASSVDVFCEGIGFTPSQCEKVFASAKHHGLQIKAHVEQLSDLKGAKLAASMGAISVDHLEYLNPDDLVSIKQSGAVAVILPGAFYYLNETQKPPIQALREHNIPMAVASDLNPGSSPIASILTCGNMASVLFGMTPEEVLMGMTCHAAKALADERRGRIAAGYIADLCLWDIQYPAQLVYAINQYEPQQIWLGGKCVKDTK